MRTRRGSYIDPPISFHLIQINEKHGASRSTPTARRFLEGFTKQEGQQSGGLSNSLHQATNVLPVFGFTHINKS